MPISHPLSLLGLLSASAAVRVRFLEENLSVFLFSVLPLAVFRFPFSACLASAAVRVRFWEENLSVFFVFRFAACSFPLSVFRFPFSA